MVVYKIRLKKDLPEYPEGCVFILKDGEWRGYWDGGDWVIPEWLEQLLYSNLPDIQDEMTDWFGHIHDEESSVYDVDIKGDITRRSIYSFWMSNGNRTARFDNKEEAEDVASQIKAIWETVGGGNGR